MCVDRKMIGTAVACDGDRPRETILRIAQVDGSFGALKEIGDVELEAYASEHVCAGERFHW